MNCCLNCNSNDYVCSLKCNHYLCLKCIVDLKEKKCPNCKTYMKNLPLFKVKSIYSEKNNDWATNFDQKFNWGY